jgi:hypothetical protein
MWLRRLLNSAHPRTQCGTPTWSTEESKVIYSSQVTYSVVTRIVLGVDSLHIHPTASPKILGYLMQPGYTYRLGEHSPRCPCRYHNHNVGKDSPSRHGQHSISKRR